MSNPIQPVTSDGTSNYNLANSLNFFDHVRVTIAAADVNQLNSVPYTLIAAQGANTLIAPVAINWYLKYGTVAFVSGGPMNINYAGNLIASPAIYTFNADYASSQSVILSGQGGTSNGFSASTAVNQDLQLYVNGIDPSTGDGEIVIDLWYKVLTLP